MNPILIMALAFTPLALLAWLRNAYPHRPLVYLALVPALMSLAMIFTAGVKVPLLIVDAVVVVMALADLISLPGRLSFSVERQTGRIGSLGKAHPVTLLVINQSRRWQMVWIRDGVPPELNPSPEEFAVRLAARSRSTFKYELRPSRRGAFQLEAVHLRVRSRLGFWQLFISLPLENEVNVYPDMKQLSEYAILARTNRLSLLGVRRTRKIGQDNEFERLRDFTVDDNHKHIDWRSTARRHKLTVKDFQANQSQRLIFLLDCGRMMTSEAGGMSLLDHALNAMLMLSFVALRQGDSVGLIAFSDEIHGFVPPRSGMAQMNRLLHASYDRFPKLVESRYDEAFLYLASHCRKRSLVVLLTNLIDEVNASQVERYLASLVGRHLPLGVLLRDHQLFDVADVDQPSESQLYAAAAAAEILTWRKQVLTDLQGRGVLALDVFPEGLTAPLVNSYLDIKARHLL